MGLAKQLAMGLAKQLHESPLNWQILFVVIAGKKLVLFPRSTADTLLGMSKLYLHVPACQS